MTLGADIESERIEYHNNTVLSVTCCPSDKTALSGAEDGTVSLFSCQDSTLIHSTLPGPPDPVNCVAVNPRETAKFYCAVGEAVFAYDKRQLGAVYDTYRVHEDEINQIAVGEKGQYLVSCDDEGTVACIDITKSGDGKCVSKHTVHDNICASVQWVPGRTGEVVSGGMDCKIHHRDVYKHRPLKTMSETMQQQGIHIVNPPFVNSISTHWRSRYMAAGYGSGAVKVWRLGSRRVGYVPFRSLPRHGAGTGCVCMVDPTTVVSGGNDGFIHISELESGHSNGSSETTSDEESDINSSSTFKLLHGHKINWLSGYRDSSEFVLFVCDESSAVTKYSVR